MSLSFFRRSLPFILAVLFAILLWQGLSHDPTRLPSALVGKAIPEFDLTTLEDPTKIVTAEQIKGSIALVNVWASWCYACQLEHPFLLALSQNQRVPIYGLNYRDDRDAAQSRLKESGDPYQFSLFDGEGRAAIDWGIYGTPETFLIDQQGIIRHRHVGVLDQITWEKEFLPLIEQMEKK